MSSQTENYPDSDIMQDESGYVHYRPISMLAVAALALAILSMPAILFSRLLFLPAFGVLLGLYAIATIKRHQEELSGLVVARIGTGLSLLTVTVGVSVSAYVYATEVPEGYERITFYQLQPDQQSHLPIPREALELDGKRVFVKGYVHPGVDRRTGIKQFVLVPDMKTCCFGGQPKLTDMIEVTLKDPLRVDYSMQRRKLAGVLRVSPEKKPVSGLDGVYYRLEADYLR